ncbi:hypothetical protein PTTG_08640 [Puccinia triticina 1-1 BBBD Race 1]|uniref:Uncharacterized protein n=1 Tax=Puccinia triticina (isolate 1-1 / race 1 (BBBD)) TaxID=630390 RepID=A0A180GNA4_PUCT1|nr:hypothetical protein PTTG_08640 [Puccinia triticina 1-1 BBBD Race 1]
MSSASNLNRLSSSSSNGQPKNSPADNHTSAHLPKKPSLTTANSQNALLSNPNSASSANPLHSKRNTPTLGVFPNSISQSPASPNSLGFGKSSFQTFGRVGDHSQPPSPGIFNSNSNNLSNLKKPFHQLAQQQSTGNHTFQNSPANRPRKLGSFNSLAAITSATNSPISRATGALKDDSDENEIEEQSEHASDPAHPTLDSSLAQHKLRSKWVFWLLHRPPSKKISEEEYGKAMRRLGSCDTVETFYSLYLHIKRPSNHLPISDLHIFVDPIKPAWEDPLNVGGGKWTIRLKKGLANRLWETLIFSLVGGGLEKLIANPDSLSDDNESPAREHKEICGAVLSIRRDEDILAVWHRTGAPDVGGDGKMAKQVKLALQTVLQLPLNCHLVYKLNADCLSSNVAVSMTTIAQNIQQNPYNSNNNNSNNNNNNNNSHHHHHQHYQQQQGQIKAHHPNYNPNYHLKQNHRSSAGFNNPSQPADLAKPAVTHPFSAGFGALGSASTADAAAVDTGKKE